MSILRIYNTDNSNNYYYRKEVSMAALKYSRQREAIKEFLATRCDHPTADVITKTSRSLTLTSALALYIAT